MRGLIGVGAVLLLVLGCSLPDTPQLAASNQKIIASFEVLNTQAYSEPSDIFCAGFMLSIAQAQSFFMEGKLISARKMHDDYDWLNCFVKGKVNVLMPKAETCSYTIQAGGTANVTCDTESFIWACDTCENLFQGK